MDAPASREYSALEDAAPQSFEWVLSSMCTEPHPDAVHAAHRFLTSNPGDPETFPTVAELESRVIEMLGRLVELEDPHGYVASGGSEANIQALRIARNRSSVESPNVVIPESGHFSFAKAAEFLDIELRRSPLDDDHRAAVDGMADCIDAETILVAAVAGSTEYGRVDPIPAIAELAVAHGIRCHVDAAWGGYLLPFTDRAWNFAHAPIDTMTIDPHKFGRAAIPAGGLLTRSPADLDAIAVETPYLESVDQVTIPGTRSGAGVASAAAAFTALWPDGYRDQYETAQANATWLAEALSDLGYAVVEPRLPIVSAEIPTDTFARLREMGWRISRTSHGELRVVCMPHVSADMLRRFVADVADT